MPMLGLSTDRRSLQHVGEVLKDEQQTTIVLMCFVCGNKKLRIAGFDKFGRPQEKGMISYCANKPLLDALLHQRGSLQMDTAFKYNLDYDYYKERNMHTASVGDAHHPDVSNEWTRKVQRKAAVATMLCCPEDVVLGARCKHPADVVCSSCAIPVCGECEDLLKHGHKIPKALTNDNFISYAHEFIVHNKVTWLEATLACPVFTGLITYYVEGDWTDRGKWMQEKRGHLLEATLASPLRSVAVRGNCFSFLLPWEQVMGKLSRAFGQGDFRAWPLDQDTAMQIVRVKFVCASVVCGFKLYMRRMSCSAGCTLLGFRTDSLKASPRC